MRKLLTFLIALASIVFAVGSPVSAQNVIGSGIYGDAKPHGGGGGSPTWTYQGESANSGSASPVTYTITAAYSWAAGDLIVAWVGGGAGGSASATVTSTICGSGPASMAAVSGAQENGVKFSGLFQCPAASSGSGTVSFQVTYSAGSTFDANGFFFGSFHGLASNTARNTAAASPNTTMSIATNTGDILIVGAFNGVNGTQPAFTGSTPLPTATYADTGGQTAFLMGYWTAATSSGTTTINNNGAYYDTVAATWQ